jgi:hypothetical protein
VADARDGGAHSAAAGLADHGSIDYAMIAVVRSRQTSRAGLSFFASDGVRLR